MSKLAGNISFMYLEPQVLAKKQSSFKVFFLTQLGHTLSSNNSIYSAYLFVMIKQVRLL